DEALAYATCQRARWRCEVCRMPHGVQFFTGKGFYEVKLTVDTRARKPRALCQHCWQHATEEIPTVYLEPSRMRRVRLMAMKLCQPQRKREPVGAVQDASWML